MQTISNAYISIDLESQQIQCFSRAIELELAKIGILAENMDSQAHVSVAYTLGECERSRVERVARMIANGEFRTRVKGVEILEGMTTPYDYIALMLDGSEDFDHAVELAEENFTVKKFSNGFRGHITLFRIQKGLLSSEAARALGHRLASCSADLFARTEVCGESVSVYNSEKQKEIQIPVRAAA